MKRDILYVDDEIDNLIVFEATVAGVFNVSTANSAEDALALLEQRTFPVVVADQRMPTMTGAELFEVMRRKYSYTKRVMLTGYADTQAVVEAINQGQVYYFLSKPWERHVVISVLSNAIEAYDLSISNTALTDRLVALDRCASVGRSAAWIAHEMGNQLCMLPLLELIEEKYADHEDLMSIGSVVRMTYERLVELVTEIKAFVRFEQDGMAVQSLPLGEVIHELVQLLRYDKTLPEAKVSVQVLAEPLVKGNKTKLQQLLINLLKNAAFAIRDRADGRIELVLASDENQAIISVKDNGCGMTPEVAARIWEPFFTTKGKEGNGMGLDVVRAIVKAHGGDIQCQTAVGIGTTFTLQLPLFKSVAADGTGGGGMPLADVPLAVESNSFVT